MHANSPLLKDEVLRIVDAITEFTLSGNKVDNSKNKEHLFFSKKDEKDESIFKQELKNSEKNQIYKELTSIAPKVLKNRSDQGLRF